MRRGQHRRPDLAHCLPGRRPCGPCLRAAAARSPPARQCCCPGHCQRQKATPARWDVTLTVRPSAQQGRETRRWYSIGMRSRPPAWPERSAGSTNITRVAQNRPSHQVLPDIGHRGLDISARSSLVSAISMPAGRRSAHDLLDRRSRLRLISMTFDSRSSRSPTCSSLQTVGKTTGLRKLRSFDSSPRPRPSRNQACSPLRGNWIQIAERVRYR